jgi:hypothetical protein
MGGDAGGRLAGAYLPDLGLHVGLDARLTAVSRTATTTYSVGVSEIPSVTDPPCPTCGQPLRHGGHLSRENAAFVASSGNAGITFETQGRCENEACSDYGREFAPGEWLTPDDPQE